MAAAASAACQYYQADSGLFPEIPGLQYLAVRS